MLFVSKIIFFRIFMGTELCFTSTSIMQRRGLPNVLSCLDNGFSCSFSIPIRFSYEEESSIMHFIVAALLFPVLLRGKSSPGKALSIYCIAK